MKIDVEKLLEKLQWEEQRLYSNDDKEAATALQVLYYIIKDCIVEEKK